jgi:hypothetical protein
MLWQGMLLGLKFENEGRVDAPRIHLSIYSASPLSQGFFADLVAEIDHRYQFGLDLADFYARFAAHPVLGPVIARWRGMRPLNCSSLYEYLMIAMARRTLPSGVQYR